MEVPFIPDIVWLAEMSLPLKYCHHFPLALLFYYTNEALSTDCAKMKRKRKHKTPTFFRELNSTWGLAAWLLTKTNTSTSIVREWSVGYV